MLPSLQISAARVANRGHDGREQMNLSQYYSYRDSQRQQLVSLIEQWVQVLFVWNELIR